MSITFLELKHKLSTRKAIVGIVGLGYVGLPLMLEFIESGFTVYGFDVDRRKINDIRNGVSYIKDIPDNKIVKAAESQRFFLMSDFSTVKELNAICICVPTPLSENGVPDISSIVNVVECIKENMSKGLLIVLESTAYPGATEELIEIELKKSGFEAGHDYFLCFSPERIDPANANFNLKTIPKVIGGITEKCLDVGQELYQKICQNIVRVSSTKVAEMSKLLENTFRSINIGFINEFSMMCDKLGIDVWEVIETAKTKPYGFMPFFPGPGVGGHCIPIDPLYLSWVAQKNGYHSKFIDLAHQMNFNMQEYVVSNVEKILIGYNHTLQRSKVLILGVSYKKEVNDARNSPAVSIISLLKRNGIWVDYFDPYVQVMYGHNGNLFKSIDYSISNLKKYDLILLLTDHDQFPYDEISNLGVPIFDTRNAFKNNENCNIFKLGALSNNTQAVLR